MKKENLLSKAEMKKVMGVPRLLVRVCIAELPAVMNVGIVSILPVLHWMNVREFMVGAQFTWSAHRGENVTHPVL